MPLWAPYNRISIVINNNCDIGMTFTVAGLINANVLKTFIAFTLIRLEEFSCSADTSHDCMPVTPKQLCCNRAVDIQCKEGCHHIKVFGEPGAIKCPWYWCCLYPVFWTFNSLCTVIQLSNYASKVQCSPFAFCSADIIYRTPFTAYRTTVRVRL